MIKILFSLCFQGLVLSVLAQETWKISSPPYLRSSNPQMKLRSIERTPQYTIVEMTYVTGVQDSVFLEICNSFQLKSGGERVAKFVKAEGAPIEVMTNQPFECEPKFVGRLVPAETQAHFKLFFEPLVRRYSTLDLIEYNGREACEFDIWGIQLLSDNPPLPAPPQKVTLPPTETRPVTVANETTVHQGVIELEIWDHDVVDGDIVSLSLNQNWVLKGYELSKYKKTLRLNLKKGDNWLVMKAENLGSIPPNTAAITLFDGTTQKAFLLQSDKGVSEALKIIW